MIVTSVANEIISYVEMCRREGSSLQRGMNFGLGRSYSVILMSVRRNAPYEDRFEGDGSTLVYEGHDLPRSDAVPNPKLVDQPERYTNGTLTQNGRFLDATLAFKEGRTAAPLVRVYEKIQEGIWSYNGVFNLVDARQERCDGRMVFKFKLIALADEALRADDVALMSTERRRIIPTKIKLEVWRRDQGRCVICGASDELHFDHDVPYSKGGTSVSAANVQLLCARHNLAKGNRIT
jgi:hypothetical protein